MLKRLSVVVLVLLFVLALVVQAPPVLAADGTCTANPSSGPVGTTFQLTARGFSANTELSIYAVDPSGTAFSDPNFNAFGGGVKSTASGTASFSFVTRFDVLDFTIARALGTWQLVVQELAPGGGIAHQAICSVNVTPQQDELPSGATLTVLPETAPVGSELTIYGDGFGPNEIVNLWASPPPGCTSFAYGLPGVLMQYSTASAFTQDDVRANAGGHFAYTLATDRTYSCPGEWGISANAPGSKRGAVAHFTLTPQGVFESGQPILVADSSSAVARGGTISFSGYHFLANSVLSCWLGRPDHTVRFVADYRTDSAGMVAFSYTTGFDDVANDVHYSEGALGTYSMSCRDNASGMEATATFTLIGLVIDP